jgi:hypothetical protein
MEEYIDGREMNVGFLGEGATATFLEINEINFDKEIFKDKY